LSAFVDSSALVKLYADEAGHRPVRQLDAVAIAQLSRVEVPAAMWRKRRTGELSDDDARLLTASFEADYFGTDDEPPRFVAVRTTAEVLDQAARLCAVHGLGAYDGVQLSSALAARRADPDCVRFAAFDRSLRTAAAAEGFALLPGDS
jgi:predicted nucleic acid-binding protein